MQVGTKLLLKRFSSIGKYAVQKKVYAGQFPAQRYYLQRQQQPISFWNDIPLDLKGDQLTCCVEIPHSTTAKMEVIKELEYHPIRQDTRKNKTHGGLQLRHYAIPPMFNYGFLPQTWEQDIRMHDGYLGDNDPLDIVELSIGKKRQVADIFRVRVLGSFCLIDQDEIDWKVLVLDTQEAQKHGIRTLQDFKDMERLGAIKNWFKVIKTYDGKKANTIAYDEKIFGKDDTLAIIQDMHKEWKKLWDSEDPKYKQRKATFHFKR